MQNNRTLFCQTLDLSFSVANKTVAEFQCANRIVESTTTLTLLSWPPPQDKISHPLIDSVKSMSGAIVITNHGLCKKNIRNQFKSNIISKIKEN